MSVYSVLLSLGAIAGSLLAGVLGQTLRMDGLLLGTALLGAGALVLLRWARVPEGGEAHGEI